MKCDNKIIVDKFEELIVIDEFMTGLAFSTRKWHRIN